MNASPPPRHAPPPYQPRYPHRAPLASSPRSVGISLRESMHRGMILGLRVSIAFEVVLGIVLLCSNASLVVTGFDGAGEICGASATLAGLLLTGLGMGLGAAGGALAWSLRRRP